MKHLFSSLSALLLCTFLALAAHAAKPAKPAAGIPYGPAPDFTLKTLTGESVRLSSLKGQVVMINFWASWCAPCRQEMPLLNKIHADYHKAGFTLLSINLDDQVGAAQEFLKSTPVVFPVLHDGKGKVAELYKNTAMPSSYFIDKKGHYVHLHQGYRPGEEETYRKVIKKLLAQ